MQSDVAWFGVVVTDTAGPGGALCMRLPYAGMYVCGRRAMVCSYVLGTIHEVDPSVCVLLKQLFHTANLVVRDVWRCVATAMR